MIQAWPGETNLKVPSTIRYKENNTRDWGFEASTDDPATLQWFKLLLVDDKDMTAGIQSCSYIQEAKAALKKAGKQPQEVVRDYLSEVWEYTLKIMHKNLPSDIIDSLPFRVVLTAPAIWTKEGKAYARLEQAAEQAGIRKERNGLVTDLRIVSEPEAAAFATLSDARKDRELKVTYLNSNNIFFSRGRPANTLPRPMIYLWSVTLAVALWYDYYFAVLQPKRMLSRHRIL